MPCWQGTPELTDCFPSMRNPAPRVSRARHGKRVQAKALGGESPWQPSSHTPEKAVDENKPQVKESRNILLLSTDGWLAPRFSPHSFTSSLAHQHQFSTALGVYFNISSCNQIPSQTAPHMSPRPDITSPVPGARVTSDQPPGRSLSASSAQTRPRAPRGPGVSRDHVCVVMQRLVPTFPRTVWPHWATLTIRHRQAAWRSQHYSLTQCPHFSQSCCSWVTDKTQG